MRIFLFFLYLTIVSLLVSCGTGSDTRHFSSAGDTLTMAYARNLVMVDYGEYITADLRNPWDTTRSLQRLVLVPRNVALPKTLPEGQVVRVPLQKSVVFTSVHSSLIDELGAIDAIAGVCDANYILNKNIHQGISEGSIIDCGQTMAPNIEKILMLQPDAILVSAYENSHDHNKVAQLGITVIDCGEYMEPTPLAQAEWMRLYGRLYGRGPQADSLYNAIVSDYGNIKARIGQVSERPSVVVDRIYGGSWSQPGALSTTGTLINDAGGHNPFDCYQRGGGVILAPEEVLYRASDADIWLLKYASDKPLTLGSLAEENPIYSKFKPYATGMVYGCNTNVVPYYDEAVFHPHWVLAEMAHLLHPEVELGMELRNYYSKMQP